MTTPDELDRVISHVAGELTRADAGGFGERVRGRLRARASARLRASASARQARFAWWPWAAVTATAATAAIVFAVVISRQTPLPPVNAPHARGAAPIPTASIATAMAPANEVVPRESRRATVARAASPAPRDMSPAELAWLARAVPPLPHAAPVDVPEFGMTSIAPRGVDLPALVIEPLGPRDINK